MERRLAVWLHLLMCRHCRAFRRQIVGLTRLARAVSHRWSSEPSGDFEATLVERLGQSRDTPPDGD
jgi:hypothetical protein